MPNSPNSLFLHTRFQLTRQKAFPSFCESPHKNFRHKESTFLSTLESVKEDMKYVGMADNTTLSIVILPPRVSRLPLHPATLFCILYMSGLQCIFLSLPLVSGNPRYVIGSR